MKTDSDAIFEIVDTNRHLTSIVKLIMYEKGIKKIEFKLSDLFSVENDKVQYEIADGKISFELL